VSNSQIVHIINNQLTIVAGRASQLASETEDLGTKKRCREIETAVQEISKLLHRLPLKDQSV
jgi:two-component sensor histidine kinase